jgi:hypothetical protein
VGWLLLWSKKWLFVRSDRHGNACGYRRLLEAHTHLSRLVEAITALQGPERTRRLGVARAQLPLHYRDPFDRQLVAQSIKRIATAGCPPLKENLRSCSVAAIPMGMALVAVLPNLTPWLSLTFAGSNGLTTSSAP